MFTVRIKPKKGECLSGYLYRVCEYNKFDMMDLYKEIAAGRGSKYKIPMFDFSCIGNLDFRKIAMFTGCKEEELISLTVSNYHKKFYQALNLLNRSFESRIRRYCPCCLCEEGYYKLIWQVKEVEVCPLHHIKLEDKCFNCGAVIHYGDKEALKNMQCFKCKASLREYRQPEFLKKAYYNNQQRFYNDWLFLLSNKEILNNREERGNLRETIEITFLYFLSLQKEIEKIPIPYIKDLCNLISRSLRGQKMQNNRSITPLNLLRTLRYYETSLEEFYKLQVPFDFYQQIVRVEESKGKCMAPWCVAFRDDSAMKSVQLHRTIKYRNLSMCVKCNLIYGVNTEDMQRVNIDGIIDAYKLLNPYLFKVKKLKDLYKADHGLSEYRLNYSMGYFLNHFNIFSNEIGYLKENIKNKQDKIKKMMLRTRRAPQLKNYAVKDFGWTPIEFFYTYHTTEIQLYLFTEFKTEKKEYLKEKKLCDQSQLREKVESLLDYLFISDTNITLKTVAKYAGCCEETLKNYSLASIISIRKREQINQRRKTKANNMKKIVEEYFECCLETEKKPLLREIYSLVGMTKPTLKKMTEFNDYITKECERLNKIIDNRKLDRQKEVCTKAIKKIHSKGGKLTDKNILREAGLKINYFRDYPKLREHVDAIRSNYE